jgi:hypothetical protein
MEPPLRLSITIFRIGIENHHIVISIPTFGEVEGTTTDMRTTVFGYLPWVIPTSVIWNHLLLGTA